MIRRVAYGIPAVALLCLMFVGDAWLAQKASAISGPIGGLFQQASLLPILALVVFLLGAVEISHMLRLLGAQPYSRFAYAMIAVMILAPWLSAADWLGSGGRLWNGHFWQAASLVVAGVGVGVHAVLRRDPRGALRDVGATFLLIIYMGLFGSYAMQIRCGHLVPGQAGVWLLLMVILVAKVSDIGAYFVGSSLGRHKLIPTISPAKSIEGAIGGLAASGGATILLYWCGSAISGGAAGEGGWDNALGIRAAVNFLSGQSGELPVLRLVIFGVCMSAMSQLGDLFESCFKRDAGIKDSSKVIPPFGGILDLIDSLMFAMPVAFFLTAIWHGE
jgi:phosphatidate cytidylyltransferase